MSYTICASTPITSVAVIRDDPRDALIKCKEFEDLGLREISVTTDKGFAMTRDQLALLASQAQIAPPEPRPGR